MPTYRYKGYRQDGRDCSGSVNADSIRAAREQLKGDGVLATELSAEEPPARAAIWRRGPGLPELALLTRRLATLLGASMPLYQAVTTLLAQERSPELRRLLVRVQERLAEGQSLAAALAAEGQLFGESYVAMVAAGEASGALDLVLDRLADFLEEQAALKSRITTALAYPLLMILVGSGVMLFLLGFVIPKITTVFADNRAALPLITLVLLKLSAAVRYGWWLILAVVAAVAATYRHLLKGEPFRLQRDAILLRAPLLGDLLQKLMLARFARVFGLLLRSGVPVVKALEITTGAVTNRAYRVALTAARTALIEGGKLSEILAGYPLFPPLLIHLIGIGEQSGTLEEMLEKAGSAFEREFDTTTTRFMALLEPLLVLAMGLAVGFVVVAVLLPIFQLNQLVK